MKKFLLVCLFATTGLTFAVSPARAMFLITLTQAGNNVVINGSGTINLAGLNNFATGSIATYIQPAGAQLTLGPTSAPFTDLYRGGGLNGPSNFGSNVYTVATTGAGNSVGFNGSGGDYLQVPSGYVSGAQLTGSATYAGQTIASLGFTPGTYTVTWGSGITADSLVITGGVPEPSDWAFTSLGALGLGVAMHRRRRFFLDRGRGFACTLSRRT